MPAIAQPHEGDKTYETAGQNEAGHDADRKGKLNVGEVIFEHVLDGHSFHFFGVFVAN